MNKLQKIFDIFLGVAVGAILVLLILTWLDQRKKSSSVQVPGSVQIIHSKDTTVGVVERVVNNTQLIKPEIIIVSPETIRLTDSIFQTPPGHIPASFRRLERAGDRLAIVYCLDTMDSNGIVWSKLQEHQFKVSPWNDYIVTLDAAESLNVKTWTPLRWGVGLGLESKLQIPELSTNYTPVAQLWIEKGNWRVTCEAIDDGVRTKLMWRIKK